MKKFICIMLIAILFTSLSLSAQEGNQSTTLNSELKKEILDCLDRLGVVEEDVRDSLIEKLERGELWDCMNDEKVSQIPDDYFSLSAEEPVKRYVFSDGSVIQQKIDILEEDIIKNPKVELNTDSKPGYQLNGTISGGTSSSGSGYFIKTKAKVSTQKGLVGFGFYADYCNVNGGYDYIINAYDGWAKIIGGSTSSTNLSIIKSKEDANGCAKAKLSCQISWAGGIIGSSTEWLYLCVGDGTAWTEEN